MKRIILFLTLTSLLTSCTNNTTEPTKWCPFNNKVQVVIDNQTVTATFLQYYDCAHPSDTLDFGAAWKREHPSG